MKHYLKINFLSTKNFGFLIFKWLKNIFFDKLSLTKKMAFSVKKKLQIRLLQAFLVWFKIRIKFASKVEECLWKKDIGF